MTAKELDKMRQIEIGEADKKELADIRAVKTDLSQSPERHVEGYREQIKNPYLFFHGESLVKLRFATEGRGLADRLRDYFIGLKRH